MSTYTRASDPFTRLKRVSPMMGLSVAQKDHSTVGSTLSQLPPSSMSCFLTPLKIAGPSPPPVRWPGDIIWKPSELVYSFLDLLGEWLSFYPLSEVVYCYDGVPFGPKCPWKVSYNVNAPLIEGYYAQHPDHLVGRLMRDVDMPLTGIASPDVILGILNYRRPEYPRP
ncbi:hypothetical protein LIER_18501 [Lithospermum erythrorhizon]|uniref:Uncharacterized protein n=1 Tax=Lithospermum erythrorhizon TaxID=34254 RepID=A0AAV3QFG8_LITER